MDMYSIHTQPATEEVLPTVTELDDDMASWQLNPKISFTEQYEIGAVVAEVPQHLHLPSVYHPLAMDGAWRYCFS